MKIGVRGDGTGLDMTGGPSGGKPELGCSSPELSSNLWKMEDVGLESPLSTLYSLLWSLAVYELDSLKSVLPV